MSGVRPHLLFFSGNRHKLREVGEILSPFCVVADFSAVGELPFVHETGSTFAENADLKAIVGSGCYDGFVLADDSGIEVDALGGAPGVRSARFAGEKASDEENTALLLRKLKGVRGKARSGRFRCVLSLAKGGQVVGHYEGTVEGVIANEPKGGNGFGYDPVFIPDGYCQTFGELSSEIKNSMSHRGRALGKLRAWFQQRAIE